MTPETFIYKYQITDANQGKIMMPKGAVIISAQYQNGIPTIWAVVDINQELTERRFDIYGTGMHVDMRGRCHLATVQDGIYVWHIFEITIANY